MANKIIGIAAGREITEAEFNDFVSRIPQQQQAFAQTEEGRRQAFDQYANYFLFEKYGKECGYDKDEEFIHIMEDITRETLAQYTLQKVVGNIRPDEAEVKKFYDEHPDMFNRNAQASAKHILVATEEAALEAKKKIEAGEKSFEDMAREVSTCPSAAEGGNLGTFGRGQMVPEFDQAVFEGAVGELIGPVQTQFGFHLIWVDQRVAGERMKYDEVKVGIMQDLTNKMQTSAYDAKRAEIVEKYGVEYK